MKIDIVTIFPKMFVSPFSESIVKRAVKQKKLEIEVHDLRKWTTDKHKTVDGKPFGGGPGMIMMIEPIYKALKSIDPDHKARRILFTAKGAVIMQEKVRELSKVDNLVLICGHYEEIDQRVHDFLVDERISIGNFILTGGEIPAIALVDAISRLLPGVLGNELSNVDESFSDQNSSIVEYPQYTRPEIFKINSKRSLKVPEVLLSGDHKKIKEWRESMRKIL